MRLDVVNVKKSFGDKEILHGISFSVTSGRAMGFLGRNGAGKSTTIRCLMDVFRQDSGDFLLDGQPFEPWKMRIGYLPEERGMYQKNKVLPQLAYFARLRGASKADALRSANYWIDYFELGEFKNKNLETLSKGNQQKIQIAQSFLNEPDILILDEPGSGLDPYGRRLLVGMLRNFRHTRLIATHDLDLVLDVCPRTIVLHEGKVAADGPTADIFRRADLLERCRLEVPFRMQNGLSK